MSGNETHATESSAGAENLKELWYWVKLSIPRERILMKVLSINDFARELYQLR
jgi:hypothetical protein